MRNLSLLVSLPLLLVSLPAQTCVYAPDAATTGSGCNVIPFGDSGTATWINQKYQMLVPGALIGTVPMLIREMGFVPCGSGVRSFDSLTVKMDHVMGPLSTTFATNLSANAVTVLAVTKYTWQNLASTWTPLGLQKPFLFLPPLGDVVIDVELMGAKFSGTSQGMIRAGTMQRVYAFSWVGTPPASGSSDSAALKVMLCSDLAASSTFGVGCMGSNGVPALTYTGLPKLNTSPTVDIASAPGAGVAFLLFGTTNGAPYPIDLTIINMPGCSLYIDSLVALAVVTNASGAGSYTQVIPNVAALIGVRVYHQYAMLDPPANATGVTTSNGGWMLVGS